MSLSETVVVVKGGAISLMVLVVGNRDVSATQINALSSGIYRLNSFTNQVLEELAVYLAGRPQTVKGVPHVPVRQTNHNNYVSNATNQPGIVESNGIE